MFDIYHKFKEDLMYKANNFSNYSGIWNVPYVVGCYLVKKSILPLMKYDDEKLEPDMALCKQLRFNV